MKKAMVQQTRNAMYPLAIRRKVLGTKILRQRKTTESFDSPKDNVPNSWIVNLHYHKISDGSPLE